MNFKLGYTLQLMLRNFLGLVVPNSYFFSIEALLPRERSEVHKVQGVYKSFQIHEALTKLIKAVINHFRGVVSQLERDLRWCSFVC